MRNPRLCALSKTTVFVKSMSDFAAMNEVYGRHFREGSESPLPERSGHAHWLEVAESQRSWQRSSSKFARRIASVRIGFRCRHFCEGKNFSKGSKGSLDFLLDFRHFSGRYSPPAGLLE